MSKNQLLIALLFVFASFTAKAQQQNKPLKPVTTAQWEEDIDYFAKQLVKKHKNAFHYTTKEKFDNAIAALKKDLPNLKDHQVVVRLMQLTSSIGDGHTRVHPPSDFTLYPVLLYWFGNEVYVTRALKRYEHLAGKRLVKIEGHPVDEVVKMLAPVITTNENDWFALNVSAQMMSTPEILQALGIVSSLEKAKFTFSDEKNVETEVELQPFKPDGNRQWVSAVATEPLFRTRINENFWFTYLEDLDAVYVNFKNYDQLAKHAKALFDFYDEKHATRMIIDIRQNGGGDFTKVRRQLIPRITKRKELNQKGNLFVITGRRTFSAAMVNSIDFKKETNATIIGEPPGEKPNSYSENDEMKLPNSELTVSYSTRYYKFLDQDVPAFEPDIRVDPNWKDFVAGVDPVMVKIRSLIAGK